MSGATSRRSAHFYPRSPCGERRPPRLTLTAVTDFYPRSPCGERPAHFKAQTHKVGISIHALLAESDPVDIRTLQNLKIFLSTLSLRRATIAHLNYDVVAPDFYPRSPCGERHTEKWPWPSRSNFYPRSPCGERRPTCTLLAAPCAISIHALLAESDHSRRCRMWAFRRFLSTLSLRRATKEL